MDNQPRESQLHRRAISAELLDVHTGCAGEIVTYDDTEQTATVRLATKLRVTDIDADVTRYVTIQDIENVEVCLPGGGGYGVLFPLEPGDPVWVSFPEQDPTAWVDGADAPADPATWNRHDFAGAQCWPGARRKDAKFTGGVAGALVITTADGARLELTADLLKLMGGSDFVALAAKVDALGSDLKTYTQDVSSKLDAFQLWASTHMHPTAGTGAPSPPAAPPPSTTVAPPTLDSTAAEKTKAT